MKKFPEQPPLFSQNAEKETPQTEPPAVEKRAMADNHPDNRDYAELSQTLGDANLAPGNEIIKAKKIPLKVKKALEEIDANLLIPKKQIRLKKEKPI